MCDMIICTQLTKKLPQSVVCMTTTTISKLKRAHAKNIIILRIRLMYYASGRFGSFENELRKRSYYWTTLRDVL